MKKLILRIDDHICDERALKIALEVVKMGKISEEAGHQQYCFCTNFRIIDAEDIMVSVVRRPSGTETFYIR